jgi:hypothetical protein
MSKDSNSKQEPDLAAIEARLANATFRTDLLIYTDSTFIRNAPADIAALLARARQQDAKIAELEAEVKGLREEKADLEQALHVAPVKAQLAIANHIFMIDAGLCLEVIAPLAHTELMKVGQQILEGVGQYDIQSQLEAEVKRLREEKDKAFTAGAKETKERAVMAIDMAGLMETKFGDKSRARVIAEMKLLIQSMPIELEQDDR